MMKVWMQHWYGCQAEVVRGLSITAHIVLSVLIGATSATTYPSCYFNFPEVAAFHIYEQELLFN